jgi:F420-dependent oxidoreductase-like protein
MKVGTSIEFGAPTYDPDTVDVRAIGPMVARVAREADEAGIFSLWVPDHLFQIGIAGPPELPMLEAYTVLAFAGGQTSRIRLGALVTAAVYREPGLLGKIITSLDVLSGGRAYLGLGAAWNEEEANGLGIPFPPIRERFERLEEVIQIILQMWAGDQRPFRGTYYRLDRPLNSPNCLQQPHPPLLIGGGGERKTLRLVAQYADACNLIHAPWLGRDLAVVRHKLDVLQEHCARLGRPYDAIEKTAWTQVALAPTPTESQRTPAQALEELHSLAELGIDHVIVYVPDLHEPGQVQLLGELARLAEPLIPQGRSSASFAS